MIARTKPKLHPMTPVVMPVPDVPPVAPAPAPTPAKNLGKKLLLSLTVWLGYLQIILGYSFDILPDLLTILNAAEVNDFLKATFGPMFPTWLKITGALTVIVRLRKQIIAVFKPKGP